MRRQRFSNWPSYKEAEYNPKWAGVIPSTQKMIKWLDPDVARFTPSLLNGAVLFSALHFERGSICGDWSGYSFLRLDAKSDTARALRVIIEDEEIEPPVVSIVELPKNQWVTVEVDLEEAVKERDLDLENIVNLTIAREDGFHYKGSAAGEILIDNLRLGRKDSSPALPKMVDPAGVALPDSYRNTSEPPGIKPLSVTPDRTLLSKSEPMIVDMSDCFVDDQFVYIFKSMPKLASVSPVGFIGAFDNKRMIIGCTLGNPSSAAIRPTQVVTKQTLDGGKTWDLIPFEPIYNPDHGSSHGSVIDDSGSCFLLSSLGCAGPGGWFPTPRVFGLRTFFTGEDGWESKLCLDYENQRTEGIFDCETRHCVSNGSCIRLDNGRMWASMGYIGRRGRIAVAAKYSDDSGATWHSWREGKLATVPGSADMERFRYRTYHYQRNCITPYENGIAVVWTAENGIHWNRFDGKEWSGKETILPEGIQDPFTSGDFYAVTVGEKDVFVTCEYFPGILHWDGTEWKKELEECVPQSPMSVSGDRLLAFSAEEDDEGMRLVCYRRSASGEWDNGEVLATEQFPLSKRWKDGKYKRAIVAQPYSPPNFAPVAWATAEETPVIKVLRVPTR